jgi:hypothetical protein
VVARRPFRNFRSEDTSFRRGGEGCDPAKIEDFTHPEAFLGLTIPPSIGEISR